MAPKDTKRDNPKQSERFKEMARKLEADKNAAEFDRVFTKVVKIMPRQSADQKDQGS